MEGKPPSESFPTIGTVEDPAVFCDGRSLLLCYEIAPVDDGGNAILAFSDVVFLGRTRTTSMRDFERPHIRFALGISPRFWAVTAPNDGEVFSAAFGQFHSTI